MPQSDTPLLLQVDLTEHGTAMLRNFLFNVAGLTGSFTLRSREAECLEHIRTTVGTHKVLVSRN